MANLPKYLDLLKVEFTKSVNGKYESGICSLSELLSDARRSDRENIISLALLPMYNKDGSLFIGAKNPSDYIKDFPMLQTLAYPSQWEEIAPKKMQNNNCPNLTTILRTVPENFKGTASTITVKGAPRLILQEDGKAQKSVETYGELVGSGADLYSIIKINPMSKMKVKSSSPKKPVVTQEDLVLRVSELGDKLDAIERKLNQGNSSQITKTKIINILKNFVGRITTEQLDSIMDEIRKGIDVNISIESMEELENNIIKAINNNFNNVHAQIKGQENEKYKAILLGIAELKENTQDDEQFRAKVLELLKNQMPSLIATNRILTDKIFMRLGQIESSMTSEGGVEDRLKNMSERISNLDNFAELCMEELGLIHGLVGELSTSDEMKTILKDSFKDLATELTTAYQKGNTEFFDKISKEISALPSVETIREIAFEHLTKSVEMNRELGQFFAEQIVNSVIKEMGELSRLDETDLLNVTNTINNFVNSDDFKRVMSEIVYNENLATKDGIEELNRLMGEIALGHDQSFVNISELIGISTDDIRQDLYEHALAISKAFEGLTTSLDNLPTKADINNLIKLDENGEHMGLIPDAVRSILAKSGVLTKADLNKIQQSGVTREEFVGLVSKIDELTKLVKENGGKVINNYYTTDKTPEINMPGVNIDVNQIMQLFQNSLTNAMNMHVVNNAVAQVYMQNMVGGMMAQPQVVSYQPIITAIAQAMQGQNLGLQINNEQNQITNILSLMLKNWGVMPSTNPEVTQLKAELDALKAKQQKDTEDLKKMLADLMDEIKKSKAPEEEKTEEKKVEKKVEPKIEKPIETPKPVGKTKLVKGTVKHLARVQEPKLPLGKRILKFVVRHPFRAAAIGLGVGVLGAAGWALGASAIAAGSLSAGASALITNANFFLPSIAIGAGIGGGSLLGAGAIGAIVSKFSKKGRKERLYTKFLKEKAKCDELAEDIELKYEKQMEAQAKIAASREKQRNGSKILKKLGVYKIARNANRKKFRKLRTKIAKLENKRTAKVYDALSTKKELNIMEKTTGKTLAMNGYLDKLRKKQNEINNDLKNPYLTEDERQDLHDDLQDVVEDMEDEVAGISGLSNEYETFDTEAEELINSVKKPSETMKDMLTNIRAKNSERILHAEDAPVFDDNKVSEYLAKARASKNPQDKENAENVAKYINELKSNNSSIDKLIDEGKISYHLARELMTRNEVKVPANERVDVDFVEASSQADNEKQK